MGKIFLKSFSCLDRLIEGDRHFDTILTALFAVHGEEGAAVYKIRVLSYSRLLTLVGDEGVYFNKVLVLEQYSEQAIREYLCSLLSSTKTLAGLQHCFIAEEGGL